MSEIIEVECPNCGETIKVNMNEFVDVSENPEYKASIIEGDFFLKECPGCGDSVMVEYPLMYMDPDKKLNIYMAPDHEPDMLDQLNSLDIPDSDLDPDAIFRLTNSGIQLMEKILIAERGRDDRLVELYKFLIWDSVKEEWADLEEGDLLFMFDEEEDYLVIWPSDNDDGEKLTIPFDDDLYNDLKSNYIDVISIPDNNYAEVDQAWIAERFEK
jgi:hypothetical protein